MLDKGKDDLIHMTIVYQEGEFDLLFNPQIFLQDLVKRLPVEVPHPIEATLSVSSDKIRLSAFSKLSDYPLCQWAVLELLDEEFVT